MWALLDDRMGSVGQAKGVMLALGDLFDIEEKKIVYTRWAKLPNWMKGRSLLGVNEKASSPLKSPWPDLVLSISTDSQVDKETNTRKNEDCSINASRQ